MLLSYSHEFIFFHVGKTAGISMREVLEPYAQEPDRFKIPRPPRTVDGQPNRMYVVWETLLLHARASDAQKELPPEVFDGFFKFGFVRNPWDWQVSMYHFLLRQETYVHYRQLVQLGGFEEYLEWVIDTPDPYPKGTPKWQWEVLGASPGHLLVDFVGRYEMLEADFRSVAARLGIEGSLPHLNASAHRDYRAYYNERSKRMVAEHFEADVELFGYDFDGVSSSGPEVSPRR